MNANGSRFKLLLGHADWARCAVDDTAEAQTLQAWWRDPDSLRTSPPPTWPAWDTLRNELTLQPLPVDLPSTSGEAPLTWQARRGAAADRNGNIYRVADDNRSVLVWSCGSGNETVFWPVETVSAAQRIEGDFTGEAPAASPAADRYLALTVTCEDYLVVAYERGAQRGLLSFDLLAGGDPVRTAWPAAVALEPFDMCAREGGGLWALDRVNQRLWELDRTLAVVNSGQTLQEIAPGIETDFQPLGGTPRTLPATQFPGGLDLSAAPFSLSGPVAVASFGAAGVLLLDCDSAAHRSRVVRLLRTGDSWQVQHTPWLDQLPGLAHDMVFGAAPRLDQANATRLFIASEIGNQVHAFELAERDGSLVLQQAAELYPLRRFGGRALIAVRGQAYYDCGLTQPRWTPVVMQPRPSYAAQAELITPVFDSAEPGTTWDRVLLDACIAPDTDVEIESRAGDECTEPLEGTEAGGSGPQVVGPWQPEPIPQLCSGGAELPWLRSEAARATRRESGVGAWELLLQRAQGRYLQLRIRLRSRNGTASPRLRALRAWYPRFSYPQRFLPAVYREDPVHGPFLERWLANFESTLTRVEDRMASVQTLFDARAVPGDALPWLAQWFDLALDPSWDERRHRLLVRHAMDFFRWRGTVHGVRLALELAFDPCFDPDRFAGPTPLDDAARHIRIVEAYQTRRLHALAVDAAARAARELVGPQAVTQQALWTPEEGNAGLVERWAKARGRAATASEQLAPFELVAPLDAEAQQKWPGFCSANLGFLPSAGSDERGRWQDYLVQRYVSIDEVNRQHGSSHTGFDRVALPLDWPANTKLAADWKSFCARRDGLQLRALWADFLARRYRRIERLQRGYQCGWPEFEVVPIPDCLPVSTAAQVDWLQFERQLLAMHRSAHRFSVLLPLDGVTVDAYQLEDRLGLARRIVELEKPAHTVFDVRFYWAFNRVGAARLGLDTQLGAGSRAPELVPDAVVGRAYLGASFVGGPARLHGPDRMTLAC